MLHHPLKSTKNPDIRSGNFSNTSPSHSRIVRKMDEMTAIDRIRPVISVFQVLGLTTVSMIKKTKLNNLFLLYSPLLIGVRIGIFCYAIGNDFFIQQRKIVYG